MWKALKLYGVLEKIVDIIKDMFNESKCTVRVGHVQADWLSVETRVRQENVLSSQLINLVLDFTLTELDNLDGGITWAGSKSLKYFDYAGGFCLLTENLIRQF